VEKRSKAINPPKGNEGKKKKHGVRVEEGRRRGGGKWTSRACPWGVEEGEGESGSPIK